MKQTKVLTRVNSCRRLTSRLHELLVTKLPFVSRIEFIRSKLSFFSAHVTGASVVHHPARIQNFRKEGAQPEGGAHPFFKGSVSFTPLQGPFMSRKGIITPPWSLLDPADHLGDKFLPSRPNLPPFSTVFTDLGHFMLKLLNFDIYFFYFMFIFNIYLIV